MSWCCLCCLSYRQCRFLASRVLFPFSLSASLDSTIRLRRTATIPLFTGAGKRSEKLGWLHGSLGDFGATPGVLLGLDLDSGL